MTGAEAVSIILGLVALAVTIVGFFASLKFYRDGVQMQSHADAVLTKMEERSTAIQTQVGGIFDKTLTAALGRTGAEAEQQQAKLIAAAQKPPMPANVTSSTPTATEPPAVGLGSNSPTAQKAVEYYALRKMRLSDISNADAASIFNLGGPAQFNLLEGIGSLTFLGFFPGLNPVEIVSRARMLLNSIEIAYHRVEEGPNPALRDMAKKLLNQISIDVVIADSHDPTKIHAKIMEYQPSARRVPLRVLSLGELKSAVEEEHRRMRPE